MASVLSERSQPRRAERAPILSSGRTHEGEAGGARRGEGRFAGAAVAPHIYGEEASPSIMADEIPGTAAAGEKRRTAISTGSGRFPGSRCGQPQRERTPWRTRVPPSGLLLPPARPPPTCPVRPPRVTCPTRAGADRALPCPRRRDPVLAHVGPSGPHPCSSAGVAPPQGRTTASASRPGARAGAPCPAPWRGSRRRTPASAPAPQRGMQPAGAPAHAPAPPPSVPIPATCQQAVGWYSCSAFWPHAVLLSHTRPHPDGPLCCSQ